MNREVVDFYENYREEERITTNYARRIEFLTTVNKYLDEMLLDQIRDTGVLKHDDSKCFWTDTYYSSYDEMQDLYKRYDLEIIDHFAQDGLSPLFHEKVDQWNDEQFETWFHYHLSVCSEKSIVDMSNHVVIVGQKR